jgi:hypothetical protein
MLFALIYLLLCRALRLAAGSASDLHNDIEIVVLRHQLTAAPKRARAGSAAVRADLAGVPGRAG